MNQNVNVVYNRKQSTNWGNICFRSDNLQTRVVPPWAYATEFPHVYLHNLRWWTWAGSHHSFYFSGREIFCRHPKIASLIILFSVTNSFWWFPRKIETSRMEQFPLFQEPTPSSLSFAPDSLERQNLTQKSLFT